MKTKIILLGLLISLRIFSQNNFAKKQSKLASVIGNTIEIASQKLNSNQTMSNEIKLLFVANWITDTARINFLSGATSGYDPMVDILKAPSSNTVDPYISTLVGNQDLVLNALPSSQLSLSIPIRVKVGITGKYILTMDTNSLMFSNRCLILEDLATATNQDLKANASYSFTISDTTNAPRFLLHIGQGLNKTSFSPTCSYNQNGMAIISGNGSGTWSATWMDSLGNILNTNSNVIGADTLKNLAPGLYPVSVTGNSGFCNSLFNDTIRVYSTNKISVNAVITNVNCANAFTGNINGNSINGGLSPYSYKWSTGATTSVIQNLNVGVYTLILIDANGCDDTTMYAVQQISNLFVNFKASADTITMASPTLTFTNQTTGQTNLSWNFGDGSPSTNNYNSSNTYSSIGTYTVELTANDAICVVKKQKTIVVLGFTAIPTSALNSSVNIYTSIDGAVVKFNFSEIKSAIINVYSVDGKQISTKQVMAQHTIEIITISEPSGIYLVEVKTESDKLIKKIIK